METYHEQMQRDMVLRNLSPKTQKTYHYAARSLEAHFGKPPDSLGMDEIKAFLYSIVQDRNLSQSTLKIHYSALKFLYETTLGKGGLVEAIPYPKSIRTLPQVLTKNDIRKIFDAAVSIKQKAMLMVTYSSGLRIGETARLKITDIDSARMLLRVEQSKGNKDRFTLLSKTALEPAGRKTGSFRAIRGRKSMSRSTPFGRLSNARRALPESGSPQAVIRSGTASPHTFWSPASICAPFSSCSAIPTSGTPRSISMSARRTLPGS